MSEHGAMFWTPGLNGSVHCSQCYWGCSIPPGQAGFCGYRQNAGGTMVIPHHGVLSGRLPIRSGYSQAGLRTFYPGSLAFMVGAIHCSGRCSFCISGDISRNPEGLPWMDGQPGAYGGDRGWIGKRAVLDPIDVVRLAVRQGATLLLVSGNEPLVSYEYTLDLARAAKDAGLMVAVFTNGLSGPEPIRKLAPFVDAVDLGVKGALSPEFYRRFVNAPGGEAAVAAAAGAWKASGVYLAVSNLVPPPAMVADEDHASAEDAFFQWVLRELGPMTPLELGMIGDPRTGQPMASGHDEQVRYGRRFLESRRRAMASGLPYAWDTDGAVTCHRCGSTLLRFASPMMECEPCLLLMGRFCHIWRHEQAATGGRCDTCGTRVPVLTLSKERLQGIQAWLEQWNRSVVSVRTPIQSILGRPLG